MELLKVFLPVVTLLGTTVYAQTQKNCTRTLDLVFVVDGSNSVHPINFNQLRTALLNSVDSLTMGPGNTRVGVVTYGTGIRDRIPITDNKQALMSAISGLQWPDGTTLTDEALDWGRSQLDSNVRDGVPRVIVVLTDGQSNDPDRTLASAQAAKAKGIQLYALGVGQLVDKTELNNIVAPHLNRVFLFDDFPALNAQLQAITVEVCQTVCTSGVDMVFVLDGSASVVSFRFRNMLTTVVATAQSFWSSYPQSRLAIITYASGVTDTVPLADVANQAAFSAAAAAIDYPNGGTTTAQGIVAANDMLRANRRGEIPRVIVVITDGRSDDPAATTRAALDAKNEGITVFAIGVGDQVDKAELERIASAAGLSTAFSDFTILSQRLSSQIGALCGQCLFFLCHSLRRTRRCAKL